MDVHNDDWEHVPLHRIDADSFPNWNDEEELFCYAVHGVDTSSATLSDVDLLKYVINQVTIDKQFDTKKPCALCFDSGHTFDRCPMIQPHVLKNVFIKLKLICNRIRATLNDMEQQASSKHSSIDTAMLNTINENFKKLQVHSNQMSVKLENLQSLNSVKTDDHGSSKDDSSLSLHSLSTTGSNLENAGERESDFQLGPSEGI